MFQKVGLPLQCLEICLLTLRKDPARVPFIVAHEFFDALPIHAFQTVDADPYKPKDRDRGGRDSYEDQTPTGSVQIKNQQSDNSAEVNDRNSESASRSALRQWRELLVNPSSPSSLILPKSSAFTSQPKPEFQLSVSKSPTTASTLLPVTGRYGSLLLPPSPAGATVEISPEAQSCAASMAIRIGGSNKTPKPKPAGAALIIDYGPSDTIPTSSRS